MEKHHGNGVSVSIGGGAGKEKRLYVRRVEKKRRMADPEIEDEGRQTGKAAKKEKHDRSMA